MRFRQLIAMSCCAIPLRLWAAEGVGGVEPLSVPPLSGEAAPVLTTPEISATNGSALSQQPHIFINRIRLEGNTVFSAEQLTPITGKFQGRRLSADQLRQLRHELSLFYIDHGYINSGAVLPEQKIENGELLVRIVEGRLSDIQLQGLEHLREGYLQSRIARHSGDQTLNIKALQTDLQLIQQNPLIERINAELAPGMRPGEALLRANLKEANPWYLTVGANNYGVPSVGAERFETWAGHRNVLGFGDGLDGHFNVSAGQTQYDFNYALPFTRWDSKLKARYQKSEADVVEKPFDQINIFNEMETFGLGLSQPVWQTLENQATLGLMLERRHSQSFLLNEPFSFSRGTIDGASNVSVVRFSQDWLHRTDKRVFAVRSVASWGVDALGSTIHKNDRTLPDGDFFVWLGQVQWIQRLWDSGVEMHLRGDSQISASPLLSLEQFTVGGRNSVRGYRQNQLVRDSGFSSSLEFRIPVYGDGAIKLAPFFDYGQAWNIGWTTPLPHTLASAGLGIIIQPWRQLQAELYWAHPLSKIQTTSHDIQDEGLHFAVNYSPF